MRQTIRSLQNAGVEVNDLKGASKKAGNVVVDESKTLVPELTGRLMNSIRASNTKNQSIVRAGGAKVPYAGVIHWGGYHNIEPHPFLTEALNNKNQEVLTVYEQELAALLNRLNLT